MRVLHVTESFGAGVATAIRQYLTLPGPEQRLLARRRPEIDPSEVPQDVPSQVVDTPAELVREWRRCRREPVDLVHVHSTIAAAITRSLPHPTAAVVYSPHGLAVSHERGAIRVLAHGVERALALRTSAFGAVSETERRQIAALTRTSRPIVVIPHSMHVPVSPVPFDGRERRVVAVGRLSYHKNPESIASLPALLESQAAKPVACMWIGEGDEERRSLLESQGWEVTGWLRREVAQELVADSLALVHPSRSEAMPYAVVEAMSLGTPVVSADLPALRDFPVQRYSSSAELPGYLSTLLDQSDVWDRAAEQAQRFVRREFSPERQYRALRHLYEAALART